MIWFHAKLWLKQLEKPVSLSLNEKLYALGGNLWIDVHF